MIRSNQSHNNGQTNATSGRPVTALEQSHANNSFEHFLTASTLKTILGTYRNLCEYLHLKPNVIPQFYPKLKAHVNSWKAKPLWKKFDYRANQKCYGRGRACPNTRVLIIGAGPCGLRSAIEAQLLGAKVVVVEKRDRMSRNNVLHLWPFVIEDLRMLGAKKFFGKFCAGAIDHISIRQLQCILMKVALLLGVEIHTEVSFERLIEPNLEDKNGWRAEFKPSDHPVSQFEFDVVLGADGKRNTLHGFKRKEFRGKLAIAITANFINKRTEAEARVEEISGVAFIFNQKFFKDLYADTGIDLENIVYYKDDTHYFVMTAKKQSLIEKSVIKKDLPDTARLLAPDNVDRDELMNYAREAAEFSTNYQMPDLEFAVNHYGQPDVAMFDFTSMYAAENASRVVERHGYKLLSILVGDSLLEPFWPTGSGCARGFLSSMDAAWAIRSWGSGHTTPLEVLSERESIYRLLAQTTPENLNKDYKSYMLDPSTRYPNLNRNVLSPHQVTGLYDTDDPKAIELKPRLPPVVSEVPKKRRRRESHVDPDTLLSWIKSQVREHVDLEVNDITSSFKDGQVLCAILHHYRPDLLDYSAISMSDNAKNNQLVFDLLEQELGIPPVMTAQEIENNEVPDYLKMLSYLTQVYDTFRCEIPHIKHPKLIEENELCLSKISTSARDANERSVNLKPLLVTPKSSAVISEDGIKFKCEMFSSSGSYSSSRFTELEDIPTKESKSDDSRTDLILIPIKSIENYLSKNDIPKEVVDGNGLDKCEDLHDVSGSDFMMNDALKLKVKRICGQSKSDPLFVKINKAKSKLSVKCKKPIHLKRNSISANSKLLNIQRRCKIKSVKTDCICKPIFKYCDDNFNEISPERATDQARRVFLRDGETSTKNFLKLIRNNTSTQTSNVSFKKTPNELTTTNSSSTEFNDLLSCKPSSSESFSFSSIKTTKSSNTNDCLKKSNNETTTKNNCSIEGSREITRDFLREMDLFLYYQDIASKKLNEFRNKPKKVRENNFKINIKCTKNNKDENIQLYPSEIPSFLLKTKKNESPDVFIKNVEHKDRDTVVVQEMKFFSLANVLRIVPRIISKVLTRRNLVIFDKTKSEGVCQRKFYKSLDGNKFLSDASMSNSKIVAPDALLARVEGWINSSNFDAPSIISTGNKEAKVETNLNDNDTDITSVTKQFDAVNNMEVIPNSKVNNVKIAEGDQSKHKSSTVNSHESAESMSKFVETIRSNQLIKGVAKLTNISAWELYEGRIKPKSETGEQFSTIVEGEESDLPDSKRGEAVVKLPTGLVHEKLEAVGLSTRPPSRHKRHIDVNSVPKPIITTQDRKTRKRKTLEKVGASVEERQKRLEDIASNRFDRQNKRRQQRKNQTEQFIKSMQMLQANCKPDHSEPFEDYSIFLYRQTAPNFEDRVKDLEKMFTYVPDRENRLLTQTRRETDEDFAARIKDLEDKWRDPVPVEKKPKDLLRAIGKIETSDWNIKEIEKKIIENKVGKAVNKDKEKVPKWSREQFLARQNKMERQHLERQESSEMKFAEIDKNIKQLEQRLKEGSTRDLNQQKVATITEKFGKPIEVPPQQPKPLEKSNSRAMVLPSQGSEHCHFCSKRVYLMERLTAEGKFFHRGCFRCQYCHTLLRLGSYMFDREGLYGKRFYCTQHYGMSGELRANKVDKKDSQEPPIDIAETKLLTGVIGFDLLDRVQTPERIEFSNLSTGHISSDHEESPSPIDEDEWTDRNFKNSVIDSDSPDDSSSTSDSNSDDDEAFEEALEEPATKEGTLKWAERYKRRYSRKHYDEIYSDEYSSSDDSSYCENSSGDEESDTATEGEEEIRARELRKQEVRVEPPVTDTGTDTEIASDESCSESSSEIQNSATEISTDSEFAHDDPTPTREAPKKIFDDYVTKTRGSSGQPKRVQVKSGILQQPMNGRTQNKNIELKFTPLVPTPVAKKPAPTSLFIRNEGYPLNRTQSTGGIATKVSLELKKKYLLGETNMSGTIQKSGSASTLDSKFKLFHTNISDCQKLLKPASEISTSMQVFCSKLSERTSPLSPTFASPSIKERTWSGLELNLSSIEFSKDLSKDIIPKLDITKCASESSVPELTEVKIVNETEGRPRSPVHERSIVVPTIDWEKAKQLKENVFTDSLSSSDSELEENKEILKTGVFSNIPRLEVHNDSGEILQDEDEEMAFDSLNVNINNEIQRNSVNEPPKSISGEKKLLNQPKKLPSLENDSLVSEMHSALHVKLPYDDKSVAIKENSSGRSSPSINDDLVTAALTETELSDWARDGAVSDDFDDIAHLDLNPKVKDSYKKHAETANLTEVKKASMAEFDDMGHICGKERHNNDFKNVNMVTECVNSVLNPKIDNIEFMDTGTETSSDDNVEIKNNGYVQFHNEDDFIEDSLSPTINDILEITNPIIKKPMYEDVLFSDLSSEMKNTAYCEIGNERNKIETQVAVIKNSDLEKPKEKQITCDNEDDSLIIIETGTTTEENTCSDSTVKNITEKTLDSLNERAKSIEPIKLMENSFKDRKRLEDKLAQVKLDMAKFNEQKKLITKDSTFENKVVDQITLNEPGVCNEINDKEPNMEFEEHCQRLQSKIEFSNVKDSIDIRKSRRKSKSEIVKPDLIQEEKEKLNLEQSGQKDVAINLTPSKLYKREEIEKERNINQRLVQEMVMNKMKAQNKSLERKKRSRNSFSPIRSFELSKPATVATASQIVDNPIPPKNLFSTPDVLLSTMPVPLQKSQTISSITNSTKPEPIKTLTASQTEQNFKKLQIHNPDAFSLPDISKSNDEVFVTPKVPPRLKNEEAKRTAEKLKQDARARVRLMSDEDLGLSPEDKLLKLKQKASKRGKDVENLDIHIQDSIESLVINTERRNSLLYNNDTLKRNTSFRRSKSGDGTLNSQSSFDLTRKLSVPKSQIEGPSPVRTKSVSDINKPLHVQNLNQSNDRSNTQFCKSDPNLLIDGGSKKEKKKCKDRERRKSITKFLTDIFIKKKDNSPTNMPNKSFLSRISPKSKNKSKSCVALDLDDIDKNSREPTLRRNSVSELNLRSDVGGNISPPPIPPLPANYTGCRLSKDESSDAENEFKRHDRSSCDTLDQSGIHDGSMSSFTGRRSGRSARKAIRQAQLKRHRMAQEIQRKLEETEVKTRELESRGVLVEKALRGESNGSSVDSGRDESDLLKEWFDLMRDRTELRRYERELIVRAQELELEDRHARLQHELRDRLESDEPKTTVEMEVEGSIIKEMMEIVTKRDSLITLLEEDRIRYSEEDRDFEEQMLAKGIHLTPLTKPPDQ